MRKLLILLSLLLLPLVGSTQYITYNGKYVRNAGKLSIGDLDFDVHQRVKALGITNGRHILALNTFIKTLKSFNSTQSNFISFTSPNPATHCIGAMWLGLGGSDVQRRANFMNPSDTTFRLISRNQASTNVFGYYGNGTAGTYFDTKLKPYSNLANKDNQLSVYIIENASESIYQTLYGDFGCNSASQYFYIDMRGTASTNVGIGDGASFVSAASDYGDGSNLHALDGLYVGVRSGTTIKIFKKGTLAQSLVRDIAMSSTLDINMYLGLKNNNGTPSTQEKFLIRYASVGTAIQDNLQAQYSDALNQFVDAINPVVIFFGNSITEGVGATSHAYRWTTVLSQNLDSYLEYNLGLASTRMQTTMDNSDPSHSAYQNRENLIPAKVRKYQYLVINLGWNDLNQGLTDVNRFKTQYLAVVRNQIAKGYLPEDIYLGNIPRALNDALPTTRAIFNQFQQAIYEIAQETGCNYVDVYGYMVENDTLNQWNVTSGNTVHLNDLGNQKIAEFWKTILNIKYQIDLTNNTRLIDLNYYKQVA